MHPQFEKIVINEFGGPEVLKMGHAERSELAPGQLRIRVAYAGVNRADLLLREGKYHLRDLPVTPGLEAAGVVLESHGTLHPGTRVLIYRAQSGMYSQEVIVAETSVISLPAGMPLKTAASLPLNWLTAFDCLDRLLALKGGERVLILAAASGVGQAAIQLARLLGAIPFCIVSSEAKADYLRTRYDVEILATSEPEQLEAWAHARTPGGEGFDGALDLVGGRFFRSVLHSTRAGGRVVQAANPSLEDSPLNVRDFYPRNLSIHGFQYGNLIALGRDRFADQLPSIIEGFATGGLSPLDLTEFKLEDAARAHLHLAERAHIGKVLLKISEDQ